ncbi:hypothetical protein K438DRAFT_1960896 [Mycena galopus ATCC 62051]|nr:hypothetical protein K438DRAFT_1960896 [Mycena galopus ATCC 62051]
MALLPTSPLRLENLARLPPDLRRLAKTAANGSLESLKRLERPVREGPESRTLLFLPVFYANLAPEGIPSPDDVDTTEPSPTVLSTLMRAFVSLQALESYPNLSPDVYPILWPRVWIWIEFLDTYHFCLGHAADSQHGNRAHFLQQIRRFRSHETSAPLVDSTHGVWTMVARMWALCVERNSFARGFAGATVVGQFISGAVSAAHFDEVVDALGGPPHLAAVVVKHLRLVTCDPRNPPASTNLYHLSCLLVFLAKANRNGLLVREAFRSNGLVGALVDGACALGPIDGEEAADLLRGTWNLLRWVVTENVLYVWMPEALKSGLLRAIVACATHNPSAIDSEDFLQVLTRDLPPSLVYYRVLKRMAKALREVKSVDLHGTAISDEWTAFVQLAEARLAALAFFRSDKYFSERACDNMKCGIIDDRKRFNACSLCQRRYYCSEDCQRIDWTQGGHKAACKALYIHRIDHPEELSRRDIYFMRALLQHDYRTERPEISLKQIVFMHTYPGTDFYTRFDYSRGAVDVKVLPLTNADNPRDMEHPFRIAQAAASGGRMELHCMFVSAGSTGRGRWFTMRSSSAALVDRLAVIAQGIDPSTDVAAARDRLLAEVYKMDDKLTELRQIH